MPQYYRPTRRECADMEQLGYRAKAVVKEYRQELERTDDDINWRDYPYVEYRSADGDIRLERLNYVQSTTRPFVVGEEIEVVRYDGLLYYRPAVQSQLQGSYWPWLAGMVLVLLLLTMLVQHLILAN